MRKRSHPNLLKIFDHDVDGLWYVSEYHENGSLDKHPELYKGDLGKVLTDIRPLVDAVSHLHSDRCVHRDIKPQNIFVASNGNLVLGDFGLIYEADKTRISETIGNVGSRDWMPAWAMSKRVDQLTSAFDVFSLGKVIWSMVSARPVLPLWYYNTDDNDVSLLFPDAPNIDLANQLFSRCIVEHENDCIATADELLIEINDVLARLDREPSFFEGNKTCVVCRAGKYQSKADGGQAVTSTFGLSPKRYNQMLWIRGS